MKTIAKLLLPVLLIWPFISYEAQVQTLTIYFDKDKPYFNGIEALKLTALCSADLVWLQGHTDNDGADEYNLALSKKRVDAVQEYIRSLDSGIKIEAGYFGERRPLNDNSNESEKTLNRRVEVSFVCDPLLRMDVPRQAFVINDSFDQEIICAHGTKVEIPAGAFGNKHVKVTISEYYTPAEIMAANLTTKSGSIPIETAGMLHITAEIDGQPVNALKPLQYKFPRRNCSEDFKLFSGAWDNNLNVNWKVEKTASRHGTATTEKEAPCRLLGWDSCEDLTAARYSAYLTGSTIDSFWHHRNIAPRDMQDGCLSTGAASIGLNGLGKIVSIKTNFEDKNKGWDKELKKFIRAYFPQKIATHGAGADIYVKFGHYNTMNVICSPDHNTSPWFGNRAWFDKVLVADYETDYIILTTAQLGWLNCDRFMKNENLISYKAYTDTGCNLRLVMRNYDAFFSNESVSRMGQKSQYNFNRIPAYEDVILISTKRVNGVIYLAIEKTQTSPDKPFTGFNYKPVTQSELEAAMKGLLI